MNRFSLALGAGLLLLCGVLMAWPILAGGWFTYLDNPAHVAEINSLAFDDGGGWSDIAWCGYPLGRMHSPVWFGGFARLVKAGLPLDPVYAFLVVLGFVTPPVVLFGLARRRAGVAAAVLLAWLLLAQKTSLMGFSSPLGGMWTFYLSCGFFLALVGRLAADEDRTSDLFWIAGLYGCLGLTHLYAIVPGILVFVIHAADRLVRKQGGRFLLAQGLAAALGAIASAAYWGPLLSTGEGVAIIADNLPPVKLLARLLWGTPMADLVRAEGNLLAGGSLATALPQLLLVGAGVAGFWLDGRGTDRRRDRLTVYGFALAVVLLVLLMLLGLFQMAGRNLTWLGHVSWRLIYFVRLGLALAALPLFARIFQGMAGWKGRGTLAAGALLLVLFSVGLGRPLRAVILDDQGAQMQEVRRLWAWLKDHNTPDWGRVYLQDPFGCEGPLGSSHVLALTHLNTGIDQVGPLYEGAPFPTVPWLVSESRKLFGSPMRRAEHFTRMFQFIPAANTTRLVLHWPELASEMVKKGYARQEYRTENFSVLALADYPRSRWAEPLTEGVAVTAERVKTGLWRVTTDAAGPGTAVLLKASWSPNWQVTVGDGPVVEMHEIGLIRLSRLPAGRHVTMLEYRQPHWPDRVSLAGWSLWLVLLVSWRLTFVRTWRASE